MSWVGFDVKSVAFDNKNTSFHLKSTGNTTKPITTNLFIWLKMQYTHQGNHKKDAAQADNF